MEPLVWIYCKNNISCSCIRKRFCMTVFQVVQNRSLKNDAVSALSSLQRETIYYTYFVQIRQINHIFHLLQSSLCIHILQRQCLIRVVGKIYRLASFASSASPPIAFDGLLIFIFGNANNNFRCGRSFHDLTGNPRIRGIQNVHMIGSLQFVCRDFLRRSFVCRPSNMQRWWRRGCLGCHGVMTLRSSICRLGLFECILVSIVTSGVK